tara:strand:- start:484 stop:1017 length:534 start_codon:yes stop_codon:yes gene_type:complete
MPSKETLRRKYSLIRKNRYFEVKESFFTPLIKIIKKKYIKNIAIYYPSNHEVSTIKLFRILNNGKDFSTLLPALSNGAMKFVKWNLLDPLKVNDFGFLDPTSGKVIQRPDLIIVPLLAYDKFKNRLGYGKGYYDKFLRKNKNILTIGLAFSFQKFNKITTSKFDVKLNYILTEKGIF